MMNERRSVDHQRMARNCQLTRRRGNPRNKTCPNEKGPTMKRSINTNPIELSSRLPKFACKVPEKTLLKMSDTTKRALIRKNSTIGTTAVMINAIEVLRAILICNLLIPMIEKLQRPTAGNIVPFWGYWR